MLWGTCRCAADCSDNGMWQSQRQCHTNPAKVFSFLCQRALCTMHAQTSRGFARRVSDSLVVGVILNLLCRGSFKSSLSFRCWFFHSRLFMATITRWTNPLLLFVQKVKDKWRLLSEANAGVLGFVMCWVFFFFQIVSSKTAYKLLLFEKLNYALTNPKCQT